MHWQPTATNSVLSLWNNIIMGIPETIFLTTSGRHIYCTLKLSRRISWCTVLNLHEQQATVGKARCWLLHERSWIRRMLNFYSRQENNQLPHATISLSRSFRSLLTENAQWMHLSDNWFFDTAVGRRKTAKLKINDASWLLMPLDCNVQY